MMRSVLIGAALGIFSATVLSLAFLQLVPEAGFSYWELWALPDLLMWSLFLGWLPGLVVGAASGASVGRDLRECQEFCV